MSMLHYQDDSVNTTTSIPSSIIPESDRDLMQCRTSKVYIQPINSNTASPSGSLSFQMQSGSGQGWLQPGTLAFQFSCTVTTSGASDTFQFANVNESASSLIKRITVSIGSQQIESCDNYNVVNGIACCHATSAEYQNNDQSIMEGAAATFTAASNTYTGVFMVPLNVGSLNTEKALPLWLMASNPLIQVDFNSVNAALNNNTGAGATCTNFSITNPKLFYTVLHTDSEYNEGIRARLMTGDYFTIPMTQVMTQSVAHAVGTTVNFNTGLNLSSLDAVFTASILDAELATSAATAKLFDKNGRTNVILYLDGERVNTYDITDDTLSYYSLQEAIGNYQDSSVTSFVNRASYPTDGYVNGWNLRRTFSEKFSKTGVPVSQSRLEIQGASAAATDYIVWIYSSTLVIDVVGAVSVKK